MGKRRNSGKSGNRECKLGFMFRQGDGNEDEAGEINRIAKSGNDSKSRRWTIS